MSNVTVKKLNQVPSIKCFVREFQSALYFMLLNYNYTKHQNKFLSFFSMSIVVATKNAYLSCQRTLFDILLK